MFDIGWDEMLFTAIIAIIVIGPKDLPLALRSAGRWLGKIRKVSGHFRSGIENMIREAELEDMEKKWREQNAEIMAAHPPSASAEAALEGDNPGTPMMHATPVHNDAAASDLAEQTPPDLPPAKA